MDGVDRYHATVDLTLAAGSASEARERVWAFLSKAHEMLDLEGEASPLLSIVVDDVICEEDDKLEEADNGQGPQS